MTDSNDNAWTRRDFVQSAVSGAVLVATPSFLRAAGAASASGDKAAVLAQIPKQHAANLKRLQDWIALPSIAAENRNYPQGAEYMKKLAAEARLHRCQDHPDLRQARRVRAPRCRREEHARASTSCTT